MIIELRKAGFSNKGAQLMLYAIHERLKSAYPEAIFTMSPSPANRSQPFRKIVDAGFYPKASLYWGGVQWGAMASSLPRKLREMYGLVLDRELDAVIDAAGFSYGDQWGLQPTRELAESVYRWKRQGTKVILMPQAFGPFTGKRIRRYIERAVCDADLVMPRDRTSYQFLTEVVGERTNIRQYPDFTNLIQGSMPPAFDPDHHRVCLVPNYRMLDQTSEAVRSSYLPFLIGCAQYLREKGANPFILVHESENDRYLAQQISDFAGGLPILEVDNPLELKGIIGASHALVGSRFHSLVSALSQGVPALGTGWSHKYTELFLDYGLPEGLIPVEAPRSVLRDMIDRIVDQQSNLELRQGLVDRSRSLEERSERMWEDVLEVLGRVEQGSQR